MKVVKERPEHLLPRATVWKEEADDTDDEADIQLCPSRPAQEKMSSRRAGARTRTGGRGTRRGRAAVHALPSLSRT